MYLVTCLDTNKPKEEEMYLDSECEQTCTSPTITDEILTSIHFLPEKSKNRYKNIYKKFLEWQGQNKITSFSENVLLSYFQELAKKYKSTSLWMHYSILKSTLNLNNNVHIERYLRLKGFLKRKSVGYQAKKWKSFTPDEVQRFLNEAPDATYLVIKVALVMGIVGGCRTTELHGLSISDYEDLRTAAIVTIRSRTARRARTFTITGRYYDVCKKYVSLRPNNIPASGPFFLNYRNGKCSSLNVGINKFGMMGRQIAKFLKLPEPESYTGHCFRQSSGQTPKSISIALPTVQAISFALPSIQTINSFTEIKTEKDWKTSTEDEYIDDSVTNETDTETFHYESPKPHEDLEDSMPTETEMENSPCQSPKQTQTYNNLTSNETVTVDMKATPSVQFINCSNITVNFICGKDVPNISRNDIEEVNIVNGEKTDCNNKQSNSQENVK